MTIFFFVLSGVQSEVFAVAFALLAAGAVILTLNVLLLVKNLSHCFSHIYIFIYISVVTCNLGLLVD